MSASNSSNLSRGLRAIGRKLQRGLYGAGLTLAAPLCLAQTLAPQGCPVFHCNAEATGVMTQSLVPSVPVVVDNNNTLGTLRAQGCSGNGTLLACLFGADATTGVGAGTLKLVDATTLQAYWGSAGVPGSQDLDAKSAAGAQVPVMFSNGTLAAGDSTKHVLYSASGVALAQISLTGTGNNYGLTPLDATYGVVSQNDGVLTLVNMTTWRAVGQPLALHDQVTGAKLSLVSPLSSSGGVLYAVATDPNATSALNSGYLISVALNATGTGLRQRSQFQYDGESGASAVIVSKAVTGWSANLVLLHVPGLNGDGINRLLGLKDTQLTGGFQTAWTAWLKQPLQVSPSIDTNSQTLYIGFKGDPRIYQYSYTNGNKLGTFDLRAIGGLPVDFGLIGHIGATQARSLYTLLLLGKTALGPAPGQYMVAFAPVASPASLVWSRLMSTTPDQVAAAWNLAPSRQRGVYCPVVVGSNNGLTRACNF